MVSKPLGPIPLKADKHIKDSTSENLRCTNTRYNSAIRGPKIRFLALAESLGAEFLIFAYFAESQVT